MIDIQMNLTGDMESGLDKLEAHVKKSVLISGAAAMALPIYEELLLQTSPPKIGRVSGNLHDAVYRVYSKGRSNDDQQVYHVSINKSKAPHWHLLEYGSSKMTARAPIRKSFDRIQDAIKAGNSRMAERMREDSDAGIDLP